MIVEDAADQRLLLSKLTEDLGYACKTAQNLKEARLQFQNFRPDVVVLDLHLPDGSAIELLRQFSEDPLYKDIVYIVISADESKQALSVALACGALDFLQKPVRGREFQIRLQNWIQLKLDKDRMARERELFGRYVSRDVASGILSGELSTEIQGELKDATILFFDLRNSTGIAEGLAPRIFAQFLTDFFTDISDIIFGQQGSVNKFMGDGLLCTFGIPREVPDAARKAVEAALAIRQHIANYNEYALPEYLKAPLGFGIGISTGKVFAGNFGSLHKVEYAVLGDPVNLAARLESLTKVAKTDILIDGPTCDALDGAYQCRSYKFRKIRGKIQDVRVFGIVGANEKTEKNTVQYFS